MEEYKLTLERAKELVTQIENDKDDPELAHGKEDYLHEFFIESCSQNLYTNKEIIKISKVILETRKIDFPRWYA